MVNVASALLRADTRPVSPHLQSKLHADLAQACSAMRSYVMIVVNASINFGGRRREVRG